MHINRWITLSASALLQCSAGVSYCFSIYSDQLKDALGYNQAQIQGLASPLVALLVVGWLPGFTYDALKGYRHIGPRYIVRERPPMYNIALALSACFPDNRHALRIQRDQSCRLNDLEPHLRPGLLILGAPRVQGGAVLGIAGACLRVPGALAGGVRPCSAALLGHGGADGHGLQRQQLDRHRLHRHQRTQLPRRQGQRCRRAPASLLATALLPILSTNSSSSEAGIPCICVHHPFRRQR